MTMGQQGPFDKLHDTDSWREGVGLSNLKVDNLKSRSGLPLPGGLPRNGDAFLEDFNYLDGHTITKDAAATVAVANANGSSVSFVTTAVDNEEAYLTLDNKIATISADKNYGMEFRIKIDESASGSTNLCFGLVEAAAANILEDNGAGPDANTDQILIFKVDGGTVWQLVAGNGATQNTDTNIGSFTDNSWEILSFRVVPFSSTVAKVYAYVNGVLGGAQEIAYASLAQMTPVMGIKNGTATIETLYVDYYL